MKRCYLIGIGMGGGASLTQEAREALASAPLVAGAPRMLESVASIVTGRLVEGYDAHVLGDAFGSFARDGREQGAPCAVFSGDAGFYSGALPLRAVLEADGWLVTVIAGVSSVQQLAARLGTSWQDWHLVSAHGTDCDIGAALAPVHGGRVFFLTGGSVQPATIAAYLCAHGFGDALLTVASRLSYPDERIWRGSAESFCADAAELPLSCVLVERALSVPCCGALDDDFFVRSAAGQKLVPMTKRIVRAAALSLLSPAAGDIVWDVGAGTGAVTVDVARSCACHVYAVEARDDACALIAENRRKAFCANIDIVRGTAPQALEPLPAPQAVFVGGSGGSLSAILRTVWQKNADARLVVVAVTLETLAECERLSQERGRRCAVTQLSVAVSRPAGARHLMTAQNPVWLLQL